LHPSGVTKSSTSFGCGKGWNVTSAGWQVTLCDPIWHVSSSSGVATLVTELLYPCYLLYLLYTVYIFMVSWSCVPGIHCWLKQPDKSYQDLMELSSVFLTPPLHLVIQLFRALLHIIYLSRAVKSSRPEYFVFTSAPPRLVFPRPPPTTHSRSYCK